MPCYDPRDDYDKTSKDNTIRDLKARVDELTQMLCFSVGEFKNMTDDDGYPMINRIFEKNKKLKEWSKQHDESDVKRVLNAMRKRMNSFPKSTPKSLVDYFIGEAEKVHAVSDYHKEEWFPELALKVYDEFKRKQEGYNE